MNETVADIVAEMRKDIAEGTVGIWSDFGGEIARSYADCIEAAHKREVETTTDESSAVGTDCNHFGNAAKMREALETISKCDTSKEEDCYTLYRVCEAALSALPRNCDIGTVAEQSDRMRRFCCDCGGCAVCKWGKGMSFCECVLAWAQMPYEEGGAK